MKALLFFCMFTLSLFQSRGQSEEIIYEYYSFKSTCFYTFTESKSSILSLYKDGSFQFEIFLNQYGKESYYTRSSYTGLWVINKEVIILNYLNQGMESIGDKTLKTVVLPNKFALLRMPVKCKMEGDNLITDSKMLPEMNSSQSKIRVLAEKWRFENWLLAKENRKVKFNTLSIDNIKSN